MRKPKRKKIQRALLEDQLFKYERRIQKLAEEAYSIRKAIELLDNQEAARNKEKEDITNALHNSAVEGLPSGGEANTNTGEFDVLDAAVNQEVLDK